MRQIIPVSSLMLFLPEGKAIHNTTKSNCSFRRISTKAVTGLAFLNAAGAGAGLVTLLKCQRKEDKQRSVKH